MMDAARLYGYGDPTSTYTVPTPSGQIASPNTELITTPIPGYVPPGPEQTIQANPIVLQPIAPIPAVSTAPMTTAAGVGSA